MNLITGGTGLLGSRLIYDLIKSGEKVRVLVRESSSRQLVKNYFKNEQALFQKIEWVIGDVLDIFSLEAALINVNQVYHCAAKISFSPVEYKNMMQVNITGTANLVNMCLVAGVKKICHVSSVAAIGRALDGEEITEQTVWQNTPLNSNYAISKYGAEREVWRGMAEGLCAIIVNPTIILGEGNREEGSATLIKKVFEGLKFYTRGVNGFVAVEDVSRLMIELSNSTIRGERFILNAENISYKNFFSTVAGYLGKQPPAYLAGPFLSQVAWRGEKLKSFFTGSTPLITKETARTANNRYYYSNQKIIATINARFMSIDCCLENLCRKFIENNK